MWSNSASAASHKGRSKKVRVLLTNDDGVDSPGLRALYRAVSQVADETFVIAPDHNWSVSGHNKTMDRPLRVKEVYWLEGGDDPTANLVLHSAAPHAMADNDQTAPTAPRGSSPAVTPSGSFPAKEADANGKRRVTVYATDGTPADCVSLAALGFLPQPPDLVISGINTGPNVGDDVTYSGTVAAAMEAHISGYASVAISLNAYSNWNFDAPAHFAARLVELFGANGLHSDYFLNVNAPNVPYSEVAGVEVTRLGKRIYRDELVRRTDPLGRPYYWIGSPNRPDGEMTEGTDFYAISHNRISVTPMTLDLTSHAHLDILKGWRF